MGIGRGGDRGSSHSGDIIVYSSKKKEKKITKRADDKQSLYLKLSPFLNIFLIHHFISNQNYILFFFLYMHVVF